MSNLSMWSQSENLMVVNDGLVFCDNTLTINNDTQIDVDKSYIVQAKFLNNNSECGIAIRTEKCYIRFSFNNDTANVYTSKDGSEKCIYRSKCGIIEDDILDVVCDIDTVDIKFSINGKMIYSMDNIYEETCFGVYGALNTVCTLFNIKSKNQFGWDNNIDVLSGSKILFDNEGYTTITSRSGEYARINQIISSIGEDIYTFSILYRGDIVVVIDNVEHISSSENFEIMKIKLDVQGTNSINIKIGTRTSVAFAKPQLERKSYRTTFTEGSREKSVFSIPVKNDYFPQSNINRDIGSLAFSFNPILDDTISLLPIFYYNELFNLTYYYPKAEGYLAHRYNTDEYGEGEIGEDEAVYSRLDTGHFVLKFADEELIIDMGEKGDFLRQKNWYNIYIEWLDGTHIHINLSYKPKHDILFEVAQDKYRLDFIGDIQVGDTLYINGDKSKPCTIDEIVENDAIITPVYTYTGNIDYIIEEELIYMSATKILPTSNLVTNSNEIKMFINNTIADTDHHRSTASVVLDNVVFASAPLSENEKKLVIDGKDIHNNGVLSYYKFNRNTLIAKNKLGIPDFKPNSPIIVKAKDGTLYNQVFFMDGDEYSIYNTQRVSYNSEPIKLVSDDILLINVFDENGVEYVDFNINNGYLTMNNLTEEHFGVILIVRYIIRNTFIVQFIEDSYYIQVSNISKDISIAYEDMNGDKIRLINEVEGNPFKATNNNGFVYVTDAANPMKYMNISISPKSLVADGNQIATIVVDCIGSNGSSTSNVDLEISSIVSGTMESRYGIVSIYKTDAEKEYIAAYNKLVLEYGEQYAIQQLGYLITDEQRSGRFIFKYKPKIITEAAYDEFIIRDKLSGIGTKIGITLRKK